MLRLLSCDFARILRQDRTKQEIKSAQCLMHFKIQYNALTFYLNFLKITSLPVTTNNQSLLSFAIITNTNMAKHETQSILKILSFFALHVHRMEGYRCKQQPWFIAIGIVISALALISCLTFFFFFNYIWLFSNTISLQTFIFIIVLREFFFFSTSPLYFIDLNNIS